MTPLLFHSANTTIELWGVELIPHDVLALVRAVLGPVVCPPDSGIRSHRAEDTSRPRVAVERVDGALVLDGRRWLDDQQDDDQAAALLVGAIDRVLLAETACLAVHAAAVAGPKGAAVIPGASGVGKSTLAGACLRVGLDLISDEAACFDAELDLLWPHPRPLGLDGNSRALLGLSVPILGPPEAERATAPALLGSVIPPGTSVRPGLLVLAERRPGIMSPELVELTSADGLAALLANCLNIGPGRPWTPERAWKRLSDIAPTLRVIRMSYDQPGDAAVAIASLLGRST